MIKVLIVEDDPMVALINRRYLEKIGNIDIYGPVTSEKDIISIIERNNIDLILLDVFLPEKNGIEILTSIRSKKYLTDVIMITATNSTDEIEKAFLYGVVDYLVKPFEFNRFEDAINKFRTKNKLFNKSKNLTQSEIDTMQCSCSKPDNIDLPKGLNLRTLERINIFLSENSNKLWTIREIASELSLSNVTIKKYMDHLEDTEKIEVEVSSGNIGRPELIYRVTN